MKTSSGLLIATAAAVAAIPPSAIPSVPAPPSEYLALARNQTYSSYTDAVAPSQYRDPQATGIPSIRQSPPGYSATSSQAPGRYAAQAADRTSSIEQAPTPYARFPLSSQFDEPPEHAATTSTMCTTEIAVQSEALPSAEQPRVTADAPAYDYAPYAEESSTPFIVYAPLLPDQTEPQAPSSEFEDWPDALLPSPTSTLPPVKPEDHPEPLVLTIITTVLPSTTTTSVYSTDLIDSEPTVEDPQPTPLEDAASDSLEPTPSDSCWTTIGTSTLLCSEEGEGYVIPNPTPTPSSSETPTDEAGTSTSGEEASPPDEATPTPEETPQEPEIVLSTSYENTQAPLTITSTQYSITNVAPPYPTPALVNGTGLFTKNTIQNSNLTTTRTKWVNPTLATQTRDINTQSPQPTAPTVSADTSGADKGDLTTRELGYLVLLVAVVVGFWAV